MRERRSPPLIRWPGAGRTASSRTLPRQDHEDLRAGSGGISARSHKPLGCDPEAAADKIIMIP